MPNLFYNREVLRSGLFNPKTIPNLALWLKADAGITIATGVSNWANQADTGSGYDASQGTAGLQPAFGTGTLNGLPGVRCGTGKRLVFGGGGLSLCQNKPGVSLFAVIAANTGVAQNIIDFSQGNASSADARFGLGISAANAINFYGSSTDSNSTVPNVGGGTHTTSGELISATYDTASQTVFVYQNGTQIGTSTTYSTSQTAFPNTASTSADLGDYLFYFSDPLAGDLFELLVFERALVTSERWAVQKYLGKKYGINVS